MEVAQGGAEDGTVHSGMSRHPRCKLREAEECKNNQQSADACITQSLGPHPLDKSYVADAVDENECKVQQPLKYQTTQHHRKLNAEGSGYHGLNSRKRSVVQFEVEERSDMKRVKRRDGTSNESKLCDVTMKDDVMASKSISVCLAEERHQRRAMGQKCSEQPQGERTPSVEFGSSGHVQLNGQQALTTNTNDLEVDGQDCPSEGSCATFAYARRDSRALQLHLTRQTDRPHPAKRRAIRLDPLGSRGEDIVMVSQQHPTSVPNVYGHDNKIAMLEGSDHRQTVLPNSARWQRLLAPEALQLLFPTMSMHKHDTTYVECITALTVPKLDLDVEGGPHCGAGNVELAKETTTQPTGLSETLSKDTVCHFDRFVTSPPTDTQHLASSLAPSQHEANTDRPSINIDAPDFNSQYGGEAMASEEGTTGAPPHMAGESPIDACYSSMNDQDLSLGQPPRADEDFETAEDICQRLGLTLDEADGWLDWMLQRWREGYCMPSCTGECNICPGQQNLYTARFVPSPLPSMQADRLLSDPHVSAGEDIGSASEQVPISEAPDPEQSTQPGNTQMLSQRYDAFIQTIEAEGTGTAISAMFQPGENEAGIQDLAREEEADADFDINEYFDLERFEKDNEEGNLHWTGRTY